VTVLAATLSGVAGVEPEGAGAEHRPDRPGPLGAVAGLSGVAPPVVDLRQRFEAG
jgi:hypothetical protein